MGKEGSSTAGGGVGAHTPQAMAVLIRIVSLHLPVVPAMTRRRQLMYTFYIARETVITGRCRIGKSGLFTVGTGEERW